MEFKKKLRTRLYVAIIYMALGVMMIAGTFAMQRLNDFVSSFGLALVVIGIVRIRNYFLITKSEESIRKREIIEKDERNLLIIDKARSTAFIVYVMLAGIAVIILNLFHMSAIATWIAYSVCVLIVIYWICYFIYQKKS